MISGSTAKSQESSLSQSQDAKSSFLYNASQNGRALEQEKIASGNLSPRKYFSPIAYESTRGTQDPSPNVVLESYRNDILQDASRANMSSKQINNIDENNYSLTISNDPIQTLYLVETALNDSKEFEVLSLEEVEKIKSQCESITQKINQTNQELMVQSKLCDATKSMAKLYSPNGTGSMSAEKLQDKSEKKARLNEQEIVANERRCEELAVKLFHLEKELMIPQGKLLKHTARILQMTHKDSQDFKTTFEDTESTYTLTNNKNTLQPINEDFLFDEKSLYRELEGLVSEDIDLSGAASKAQMEVISRTEKKLVSLNEKLREIIVKVNPNSEGQSRLLPGVSEDGKSLEMLQTHIEFLEQSVSEIGLEQGRLKEQYDRALSQNSGLQEQKEILKRQIIQQREQNSLSDSSKDEKLKEKINELAEMIDLLTKTRAEVDDFKEQADSLREKLLESQQQAQSQSQSNDSKYSSDLLEAKQKIQQAEDRLRITEERAREAEDRFEKAEEIRRMAQADLRIRDEDLAKLEMRLQKMQNDRSSKNAELDSKSAVLEMELNSLKKKLALASSAKAELDMNIKERDNRLVAKEREIDEAQMDIARLQTEVTIAKAELEGAYGSRAQRAAQMASNPAIQKEIDRLSVSNNSLLSENAALKTKLAELEASGVDNSNDLRRELTEIVEEYEKMTKESIEWEKEREKLEGIIDSLREAKEDVEAKLSDEKVQWMGMRNPDGEALSPVSTSTTVLKNEFKKMMRDTRAENAKLLRAEQAERRRLEDELRALRKSRLNSNPGSL